MQVQPPNLTKSKSEACHNFWQPLVKKIYAQNADVISLHKRDVLAAFTRLQKKRSLITVLKFLISKNQRDIEIAISRTL